MVPWSRMLFHANFFSEEWLIPSKHIGALSERHVSGRLFRKRLTEERRWFFTEWGRRVWQKSLWSLSLKMELRRRGRWWLKSRHWSPTQRESPVCEWMLRDGVVHQNRCRYLWLSELTRPLLYIPGLIYPWHVIFRALVPVVSGLCSSNHDLRSTSLLICKSLIDNLMSYNGVFCGGHVIDGTRQRQGEAFSHQIPDVFLSDWLSYRVAG